MGICVVGAGSWGTAVARHLGNRGLDVTLWSHNGSVAAELNAEHTNGRYLPGCTLPANVAAECDLGRALEGAEAAVFVVPSSHLRATAGTSAPHVGPDVPVVVLTKGIEIGTSKLMTEVVSDELGNPARVAALSGPNHAEEVARDLPAAAVIAATDEATGLFFQGLFHTDAFRTYVSPDVVGVEVCAAAKNVVAIACGIARGLGMGDNTCAALMTRGLAEMARLVHARGGDPMTCMGLAGMGDLVATCTSQHSRNQTFGAAFAKGESLAAFEERTHMVVEGARACVSVRNLAQACGVETPIADAVHALLYEDVPVTAAVDALYARTPSKEFYGMCNQGGIA